MNLRHETLILCKLSQVLNNLERSIHFTRKYIKKHLMYKLRKYLLFLYNFYYSCVKY